MSAVAAPAPSLRPLARLRADAWTVRGVAFAALALFGALNWGAIVRPGAPGTLLGELVVALVGGAAIAVALRELRGGRRVAAVVVALLVTLLLLLAVCGVDGYFLRPDHWDELTVSVGNAIGTLPALRMPYRGVDPWVRSIIVAGGGVLILLATVLLLAPRPRVFGAAVTLTVLYVTSIVEHRPEHPFFDGAVFALLLGGLLWGDRFKGREGPVAASLGVVAVIASTVLAPHLSSDKPWVDYEAIAESLQGGKTTTFSWNHSYAPLTWPRNGLELARVKAKGDLYMKTENLEDFDGREWVQARGLLPDEDDTEIDRDHENWTQTIHVEIKGLKSQPFIGAGTTLSISNASKHPVEATPGTFQSDGKPLRRGDGYDATVYYPQPGTVELHGAGEHYPAYVYRQLGIQLPNVPGYDDIRIQFPPYDSGSLPVARGRYGFFQIDVLRALDASPYAREYRLAQQLAAASVDPYDLVRNTIARVQRGARYTETPPPPGKLAPLDAFLFRDHAGYCQHFAGATALLLRMAGVPARVVAGFSPGSRDGNTHILRDLDAHSWVEVYFPRIGWVTFDPTPADSPARSQLTDTLSVRAAPSETKSEPAAASDRRSDPASGGAAVAAQRDGTDPTPWIVAGAVVLLMMLTGVGLVVRHRRRLAATGDPELEELRLALARSGRPTTPDMTLQKVERLLAGSEGALGYVRALRVARYGPGAAPPTAGQRRALRRELAAGLGLRGKLRAVWALPPRSAELWDALRPRRRRSYT